MVTRPAATVARLRVLIDRTAAIERSAAGFGLTPLGLKALSLFDPTETAVRIVTTVVFAAVLAFVGIKLTRIRHEGF